MAAAIDFIVISPRGGQGLGGIELFLKLFDVPFVEIKHPFRCFAHRGITILHFGSFLWLVFFELRLEQLQTVTVSFLVFQSLLPDRHAPSNNRGEKCYGQEHHSQTEPWPFHV